MSIGSLEVIYRGPEPDPWVRNCGKNNFSNREKPWKGPGWWEGGRTEMVWGCTEERQRMCDEECWGGPKEGQRGWGRFRYLIENVGWRPEVVSKSLCNCTMVAWQRGFRPSGFLSLFELNLGLKARLINSINREKLEECCNIITGYCLCHACYTRMFHFF